MLVLVQAAGGRGPWDSTSQRRAAHRDHLLIYQQVCRVSCVLGTRQQNRTSHLKIALVLLLAVTALSRDVLDGGSGGVIVYKRELLRSPHKVRPELSHAACVVKK